MLPIAHRCGNHGDHFQAACLQTIAARLGATAVILRHIGEDLQITAIWKFINRQIVNQCESVSWGLGDSNGCQLVAIWLYSCIKTSLSCKLIELIDSTLVYLCKLLWRWQFTATAWRPCPCVDSNPFRGNRSPVHMVTIIVTSHHSLQPSQVRL